MTWDEIGRDNLLAARSLLREGRWRSCVSRAYYAAFCVCNGRVERQVKLKPGGWTFTHNRLPSLVRRHLAELLPNRRSEIADILSDLRDLRKHADYDRRHTFAQAEARNAVVAASRLFRHLEVPHDQH